MITVFKKYRTAREYCLYVGGKPTEIDKFLYYEKVYSKRRAIKRAKELWRLFKATVIVEEWKLNFVKPCSLRNGLTKGQTISFSFHKVKEAAA